MGRIGSIPAPVALLFPREPVSSPRRPKKETKTPKGARVDPRSHTARRRTSGRALGPSGRPGAGQPDADDGRQAQGPPPQPRPAPAADRAEPDALGDPLLARDDVPPVLRPRQPDRGERQVQAPRRDPRDPPRPPRRRRHRLPRLARLAGAPGGHSRPRVPGSRRPAQHPPLSTT